MIMHGTRLLRLCALIVTAVVLFGLVGCHAGRQDSVTRVGSAAVTPCQAGLRGDLNGSGLPDITDAVGILRIIVALDGPNALADCDCDGLTGITDAIALLRCLVGLAPWPITCGGPVSYTFTGLEYVVTQPGGKVFVVRSRGTGEDLEQAHLDVYIEQPVGGTGTTALRGDPAWFYYESMTAAEAAEVTDATEHRVGNLPSPDADYWFDVNSGSDQGGYTYRLHTAGATTTSTSPQPPGTAAGGIYINVSEEPGGDIYLEGNAQPANRKGAVAWGGPQWIVNDTWAHTYFTDIYTNARIVPVVTEQFDADPGNGLGQTVDWRGCQVLKRLYTYTIPVEGDAARHLETAFIDWMSYRTYSEADSAVYELVFQPRVTTCLPNF